MKPNIGQGDKGATHLFGAKQVNKDGPQVHAYGDIDELNSYIGLIRSFNKHTELDSVLEKIQEDLFVIGSQLAGNKRIQLSDSNVKFLEENILKFEKDLPELRKFILPTGTNTASMMHVARTICRRCERNMVSLKVDGNAIPYINRLSDLLFTLARYSNLKEGKKEKEWNSR